MAAIDSLERLREIIPDPGLMARAKIGEQLDEQATLFIRGSRFLVMATLGLDGLEVSPKGDDGPIVEIVDDRTLLFPERNGSQLAMGLANIIADGRVAMIFFRPGTNEMFRVVGRAQLLDDPDLCERLASHGRPALLVIRIATERCFFHCGRAVLRAGLWDQESWDTRMKVSMGRIIGRSIGRPEYEEMIDTIAEERDRELWS